MDRKLTYRKYSKRANVFRTWVSAVIAFGLVLSNYSTAYPFIQDKPLLNISEYQARHQLKLRGSGHKKVMMVHIFKASFYLTPETPSSKALADVPKMLELHYNVAVPRTLMSRRTLNGLKENTSPEEYAALKERIERLTGLFINARAGDHFVNFYVPGVGTKFIHNGELIDIIPGHDFAKALFSLWIGDVPVDEKLKEKLLGSNPS